MRRCEKKKNTVVGRVCMFALEFEESVQRLKLFLPDKLVNLELLW